MRLASTEEAIKSLQFNGFNGAFVITVSVGSLPSGVAVNPTTSRIYVANQGGNSVRSQSEYIHNLLLCR